MYTRGFLTDEGLKTFTPVKLTLYFEMTHINMYLTPTTVEVLLNNDEQKVFHVYCSGRNRTLHIYISVHARPFGVHTTATTLQLEYRVIHGARCAGTTFRIGNGETPDSSGQYGVTLTLTLTQTRRFALSVRAITP